MQPTLTKSAFQLYVKSYSNLFSFFYLIIWYRTEQSTRGVKTGFALPCSWFHCHDNQGRWMQSHQLIEGSGWMQCAGMDYIFFY